MVILEAILIGVGATVFLDICSAARMRFFKVPFPDFRFVGRWFAHMTRGRFAHASIAKSSPVKYERVIGWLAHYLIGIAFAGVLLAIWPGWTRRPTLIPALIVGIGSVAAPFLLMQPGMGAGIAARRTPDPGAARRRSIVTHTIFAIGLYAAGWIVSLLEF